MQCILNYNDIGHYIITKPRHLKAVPYNFMQPTKEPHFHYFKMIDHLLADFNGM